MDGVQRNEAAESETKKSMRKSASCNETQGKEQKIHYGTKKNHMIQNKMNTLMYDIYLAPSPHSTLSLCNLSPFLRLATDLRPPEES